ncbi:MAG TPA: DUF397 domain-containing protein [Streptosporangiaceae bacterium]
MRDPRSVQPGWRVSTRSNGTNCVEVGHFQDTVLVRDTKNQNSGMLSFPASAWRDFTKAVQRESH